MVQIVVNKHPTAHRPSVSKLDKPQEKEKEKDEYGLLDAVRPSLPATCANNYVVQVVDGITLQIDHVLATVRSDEFEAILQLRTVLLRSMSPNWEARVATTINTLNHTAGG